MTDNDYRTFTSADERPARWSIGCRPSRVSRSRSPRLLPITHHVECPTESSLTAAGGPSTVSSRASSPNSAQQQWLNKFWERSDVVVHGQPALQQAIRWNLFQVAQATARAEQSGVPAKGVTGTGYSGHYFWDTEIFVLPFLTYTSPQMARSELRFRYNMLGAARRRAEELAQSGALFPWRTVNGEEASAYYAAGTAQYHIDADIAYALCKYVAASGDQEFMNREGVDLLVETARLWADLGFWRENGTGSRSFHIHGVTGPDEYTTVVNDNLFTNVMARFNLAKAAELLRQLEREFLRAYQRVRGTARARVPRKSPNGPHAQSRCRFHTTRSPESTRRTPTSLIGKSGISKTLRQRSDRCSFTITRW